MLLLKIYSKINWLVATIIFYLLLTSAAFAQVVNVESSRLNSDSNAVVHIGGFNFVYLQQANAVTNLGANWTSQMRKNNFQLLFLANANLVQAARVVYDCSYTTHLRLTYRLNTQINSETFVQYQFNQVYGLQSRFLAGQGVRLKVFKKANARMYYGTSVMYEWEKPLADPRFTAWNNKLRWSNYLSFTLSHNYIDFNGTTYYQPALNNFSNFRLSTQYALVFRISKHFAWKNEWSLMYFSLPYEGVDPFNSRFMSGLEVNL